RGRNTETGYLDRRPIVSEHGEERLGDRGVRGVASLLGEEAGGGDPLDEPERLTGQEAVLLGNLVVHKERYVPGFLGHRVDLLAHHAIDEQRCALLLLFSGERVVRTGDADARHLSVPYR